LKKSGRSEEAGEVKALSKPSVSAWAVNQLYWNHRDAFNALMSAGQQFRRAQALQLAGKPADTRGPLADRREALSSLSHLADALLRQEGHGASSETLRRIGTTLEALSALSGPERSSPGRLTQDIDPPGFGSLAELMPVNAAPAR